MLFANPSLVFLMCKTGSSTGPFAFTAGMSLYYSQGFQKMPPIQFQGVIRSPTQLFMYDARLIRCH